MELVLESSVTCIHQKAKTFLLRVTVILPVTQMMLLTLTSHSGLANTDCQPTVSVVHRFTWGPAGS